jgi:hypothetical protein
MTPRVECVITGFASREKPQKRLFTDEWQSNSKATPAIPMRCQCQRLRMTVRTQVIIDPSLGFNLGYTIRHSLEEVVVGECQR